MKKKPVHIIQKEVLDISFPDFEAARNWETNDRQALLHTMHQVIGRCFEEYKTGDDYLIIDRLEVDLGIFEMTALKQEIPERLYAELNKVLGGNNQHFTNGKPVLESVNGEAWDYPAKNENNQHSYSGSRAGLESLLYFLRHGYLTWWASGLADWNEEWLQKLTTGDWDSVKQFLLSQGRNPVLRLTSQFNDDFLSVVIKGLGVTSNTMDAWRWFIKVHENWPENGIVLNLRRIDKPLKLQELRQQYWVQWIDHAIDNSVIPALSKLLEKDIPFLTAIKQIAQKPDSKDDFPFLNNIPAFWKNELEMDFSLEQSAASESISFTKMSPKKDPALNVLYKQNGTGDSGEMLFVNDAGLILLHPFLPQLFRNCGWVEEQQFRDDYAQTKSVQALHYLVTGVPEAPEYQLLLPKLLCGMPWEAPLEPIESLEDSEKMACEELLTDIIKHWGALGGTSPDGLREGFLQRSGKLEPTETGWRLEVERKAQDILMGRMPWGISIVKYPWMGIMLSVSWK